jgi:hypothetical protein
MLASGTPPASAICRESLGGIQGRQAAGISAAWQGPKPSCGIGITPFLSWLRGPDERPLRDQVDLLHSSSDAGLPFADEIRTLAGRSELVQVRIADSRQGHLTAERIMADARLTATPAEPVSVLL